MMSPADAFHGTWKITDCANLCASNNVIIERLEGVVFALLDSGEVVWEIPPEVDAEFPLFQCDCYEVIHTFVGVCIQMGAVSGHIFELWVDRPVPRDMMLLTFEGWCMIQCQQIHPLQPPMDFPYSLLSALTHGFFTDLSVPVSNIKIHSVVLELSKVDLNKDLANLPQDVLQVFLHYVYSQSLPADLTGELAEKCSLQGPPNMTRFIQLCQSYVHRMNIKQRIFLLVNEVHSYAEGMALAFKDRSVVSPSKLVYVMKATLRDACVAFMKLVELCVLYGEEAPGLNREERLEILKFAKTRLPLFLTQFVAMLKNIKTDFLGIKHTDRNDIAAHVAPELESLVNGMCNLMREAKEACSEIWTRWSTNAGSPGEVPQPLFMQRWTAAEDFAAQSEQQQPRSGQEESSSSIAPVQLKEAVQMILRRREVVRLHHVQAQVAAMHLYLMQKKENFEDMTTAVKIRCVSRNLEQLLEELPVFLLRLEEIMIAFDDRFQWKDFKFCLQLAISQVYQTIVHMRSERHQLQKFFTCFSELIQRDEFHQSLVNLGLIANHKDTSVSPKASPDSGISSSSCSSTLTNFVAGFTPDPSSSTVPNKSSSSTLFQSDKSPLNLKGKAESKSNAGIGSGLYGSYKLELVDQLCSPAVAKDSILAKNATNLLENKNNADMVFEIVQDDDRVEILAHRVIIAARCDHFRRALLSGMKESIQKRIIIHDCSAYLFKMFLSFVYTGSIANSSDATLETLSELIALADRYELDILKVYCEHELAVRHLDEASAIFLLSMADQYNARTLRAATMEYIACHPGIMGKDTFEELSPELQMEVYDITMWSKPKKVFSIPDELLSCPRYMLVPDSPSDDEHSSSGTTSPLGGVGISKHTHHHRNQTRHSHAYGSSGGSDSNPPNSNNQRDNGEHSTCNDASSEPSANGRGHYVKLQRAQPPQSNSNESKDDHQRVPTEGQNPESPFLPEDQRQRQPTERSKFEGDPSSLSNEQELNLHRPDDSRVQSESSKTSYNYFTSSRK